MDTPPDHRPTSLKVLNLYWPIRWVPLEMEHGTGKFAWTDLDRQIIFISEGLSPGKTADSFMHEVLHTLWWSFSFPDEVKEENFCRLFSSGLLMVWQDNPGIFAWVQGLIVPRETPRQT